MASTTQEIEPTIAAILEEAEQLQLHLILQQRRAEKIAALKEYIGHDGTPIQQYPDEFPEEVYQRMAERLDTLNEFEMAELSWAGNAAIFGTPISAWMHVWATQKSGQVYQPGGFPRSFTDGIEISNLQPHPAMVQKYEYLVGNVMFFLKHRVFFYRTGFEVCDVDCYLDHAMWRYLATCYYPALTWENIVPNFTTDGQKTLQWLQEYWCYPAVWQKKSLYYQAVSSAIEVTHYKQMEDLVNVPQSWRLFTSPDEIESLIWAKINRAAEKQLREELKFQGLLEQYLRNANTYIEDEDREYPGAGDEFAGSDPNSYDGLDEWLERRARQKKEEEDRKNIAIALAAMDALQDEHGE